MPLLKSCVVFFLLVLVACTRSNISDNISVDIAPNANFFLALPNETLWGTELNQLMEISFDNATHQLVLLTAFNADGIAMVAITPSGMPLFEITFNNDKQIKVVKHLPISGVSPAYILADLQLVYWPIELLNKQLSQGLIIVENEKGERLVLQDNKLIIRINKNENGISYQHLLRHYQFTITDLG